MIAMQLFVTQFSPYARMTRILLREKQLQHRVDEVLAQTRTKNSPYYGVNPSGRVPYLIRSDGTGIEGSRLILEYLDQLDDKPILNLTGTAEYWEYARLEEVARSLMDGVSVWVRELRRPESHRSQVVIEHEKERAVRMLESWESDIERNIMQGPLNYPQLTLACALSMDEWNLDFKWREKHPKLVRWLKPFSAMPSFAETVPPSTLSEYD